jgi:hypothetical protein
MRPPRPTPLAALLTAGLLSTAAVAQAPAAPGTAALTAAARVDDARDTVRAERMQPGERIVLDGTLNHPAWQRAVPHRSFVGKDPTFGEAPPQRTEFRVLFDEQALYVGVVSHDDAPQRIRDDVVRTDQVQRTQDFVVVYIDAIGSKRSAQFFRVNAAGSTGDGLHTAADDSEDFSPDFDWDAAVARHAQIHPGPHAHAQGLRGWTAVFRLPFASLRYAPGAHDWRILVARRMPREHFHMMTSAPIPRDAPSFIHTLHPLKGVTIPKDSQFLTVRPSVTLRRESPDAGGRSVDTSLDVKWRPRAELVVDATVNPDFSQLALDVPQLAGNSRFALYFPEKRPFFFESADLLRSPTEAFYTRSYTQPRWGLRGTWRDTGWAGSAFALNDKGGGLVLLPGAYGTDVAPQPASSAVAFRARSDGGVGSGAGHLQWGGLAAARRYAQGRGENTVLGPDVAWQINDAWRLRGQWLLSNNTALPDASGRLREGPAQGGQKRYLRAYYQGDEVEANLGLDDATPRFRHDSGFVNQAGVRHAHGWYSRVVHKGGWFDEVWFNTEFDHTVDAQGDQRASIGGGRNGQTVQSSWRPGVWARGASGLEAWAEYFHHSTLRTSPQAPLLAERFAAVGFSYTPAAWFPLLEGKLVGGHMADTASNTVRPGGNTNWAVKLRPLRALELEASTSAAWLRHGGGFAYREVASQLLSVWHFDARHTLRGIVQRTGLDRRPEGTATGLRERGQIGSLTYTWRESAGTQLNVGASLARQRSAGSDSRRDREVFVKLQLDWDEARQRWTGARSVRRGVGGLSDVDGARGVSAMSRMSPASNPDRGG